jgi:tetratricopeptide (TPR) repeat protein
MLQESAAESERARHNNPQVKINSSAMNAYLYLGEYDRFLESLPANDSAYVLFYHGFGEYYQGNREQAARDFDRAYELDPSLLPADVGKALSYGIHGDSAAALHLLDQTERRILNSGVRDAELLYKVAQAYAVSDDKASALRMLLQSIEGAFSHIRISSATHCSLIYFRNRNSGRLWSKHGNGTNNLKHVFSEADSVSEAGRELIQLLAVTLWEGSINVRACHSIRNRILDAPNRLDILAF